MAAKFTEIPVFVKGEPGFAAKLNQLGAVLAEVIEHIEACPAKAPAAAKAPARKTATTK